jgi:hypothetical protein
MKKMGAAGTTRDWRLSSRPEAGCLVPAGAEGPAVRSSVTTPLIGDKGGFPHFYSGRKHLD